jgi:hypothetical protein
VRHCCGICRGSSPPAGQAGSSRNKGSIALVQGRVAFSQALHSNLHLLQRQGEQRVALGAELLHGIGRRIVNLWVLWELVAAVSCGGGPSLQSVTRE